MPLGCGDSVPTLALLGLETSDSEDSENTNAEHEACAQGHKIASISAICPRALPIATPYTLNKAFPLPEAVAATIPLRP